MTMLFLLLSTVQMSDRAIVMEYVTGNMLAHEQFEAARTEQFNSGPWDTLTIQDGRISLLLLTPGHSEQKGRVSLMVLKCQKRMPGMGWADQDRIGIPGTLKGIQPLELEILKGDYAWRERESPEGGLRCDMNFTDRFHGKVIHEGIKDLGTISWAKDSSFIAYNLTAEFFSTDVPERSPAMAIVEMKRGKRDSVSSGSGSPLLASYEKGDQVQWTQKIPTVFDSGAVARVLGQAHPRISWTGKVLTATETSPAETGLGQGEHSQ